MRRGALEEEERARRLAVLGPFGLGRPRKGGTQSTSLPSRADLLDLSYSLDGQPFIGVSARTNINTLNLDYSLDGQPFIGVSA